MGSVLSSGVDSSFSFTRFGMRDRLFQSGFSFSFEKIPHFVRNDIGLEKGKKGAGSAI